MILWRKHNMSLPTILYCLIFLIKLFGIPKDVSAVCSPVVKGPACGSGYLETPIPKACIKYVKKDATFDEAQKECEKIERGYSSLFVAYNKETFDLLSTAWQRKHPAWIGLTDKQRSSNFVWLNGQPERYKSISWYSKYGYQCAFVHNTYDNGDAEDAPCNHRHKYICMTRHQVGPREMVISTKPHANNRSPMVVYKGRDVQVRCSAFLAKGTDPLIILDDKRATLTETSRYFSAEENSLGMCTNRTTTEITIKNAYDPSVPDVLIKRTHECYSRKLDTVDKRVGCHNKPLEFCRKQEIGIILLDPPIKKPTLESDFSGYVITCEVNVGLSGNLTWVLYINEDKPEVLQEGDSRVKDTTRVGAGAGRWTQKSTLNLDEIDYKVGCFDHNSTQYFLLTTCESGDLFCATILAEASTTKNLLIYGGIGGIIAGALALIGGGVYVALTMHRKKADATAACESEIKTGQDNAETAEDTQPEKVEPAEAEPEQPVSDEADSEEDDSDEEQPGDNEG